MHDQREKLAEVNLGSAKLDSTLTARVERATVEDITAGEHESSTSVTPEQLERPVRIAARR